MALKTAEMPRKQEADLLHQLQSAQAEIDALRQQLEHAHRMCTLGTLAAGMAHEINNVLTPGAAYGQLVRSNPDDPEVRNKALQKALRSIDGASRIVQSMLGLACETTESSETALCAAVETAIEYLPRDPAKDGIRIEIDVDPDLRVRMRPIAVEQVLLNLLLNACNALRPGGGLIRIQARPCGDGALALSVSDNGPGIAENQQEAIFEPFTQSGSPPRAGARRGKTGLGLGLAISRMLAEEAGGRLDVRSEPGSGATFTIVLPEIEPESRRQAAG